MDLYYPNKKTEEEILKAVPKAVLGSSLNVDVNSSGNKLIQGDNLGVLRALVEDYGLKGGVDLIYIDPPFATNSVFTIGLNRANTISSSKTDAVAYEDNLLGADFLEFLRERLVFLRELLSERGSIYLHIDYKIGHYVKIIMDEIFGKNNFRNDITRIKCNPKNFQRKAYGNIKDLILFYTKSDNAIWNDAKIAHSNKDIETLFKKVDSDGRKYTTVPLHAPGETVNGETGKKWKGLMPPAGRHWRSAPRVLDELDQQGLIEWSNNGVPRKKVYADDSVGKKIQDIWEFKDPQYPVYPTEKNIDLLRTIIRASSNPGSLVLDCFCGSGTTFQASQELGRYWVGVDNSNEAIKATEKRLENTANSLFTYKVKYNLLVEDKYVAKKIAKHDVLVV